MSGSARRAVKSFQHFEIFHHVVMRKQQMNACVKYLPSQKDLHYITDSLQQALLKMEYSPHVCSVFLSLFPDSFYLGEDIL